MSPRKASHFSSAIDLHKDSINSVIDFDNNSNVCLTFVKTPSVSMKVNYDGYGIVPIVQESEVGFETWIRRRVSPGANTSILRLQRRRLPGQWQTPDSGDWLRYRFHCRRIKIETPVKLRE